MKRYSKHRKYTDDDILVETKEYLKGGMKLVDVARMLHIPISTLSWHLTYPLRDIDHTLWEEVRIKVHKSKCANGKRMNKKRWGK